MRSKNYAYTWPLRAEDWRQPFTRNPSGYVDSWSEQDKQDLELAEKARDFLAGRAGKFIDRARGADVTQLTKQIYLFMEDLGAPPRAGKAGRIPARAGGIAGCR